MDNRKDQTRRQIADSFKRLMLRYSFEKISIMDITNEAGIRRPSFYNHFQDKYDLLEWIVNEDVIAPAEAALARGEYRESLHIMIERMLPDSVFYKKAFTVEGQNGFFDAFVFRLQNMFLRHLPEKCEALPGILSCQQLAHFNAECYVSVARSWLLSCKTANADELTEALMFLNRNTLWGAGQAFFVGSGPSDRR